MHQLNKIVLLAIVVIGLVSVPVFGEFYQYTDANGVQRFTDDIAAVPPAQRPEVKTHQSVKSAPDPPARESGAGTPASVASSGDTPLQTGTWNEEIAVQARELDRMQVELEKTYRSLQAESDALAAKAPPAGASDDARADHRRKVRALNAKIDDYETRYAEFREKQKAFNEQYRK